MYSAFVGSRGQGGDLEMSIREKLQSGGHVIGSWVNTASPIVAELMAAAGFDFLAVDAEHSAVDLPTTQVLFQAMRSGSPRCSRCPNRITCSVP